MYIYIYIAFNISELIIYELILYFLELQVRQKSSVGKVVIDQIAEFIQESYPNNESGIVYCFSRKECEQVCVFYLFCPYSIVFINCYNLI